MDDDDIFVIAMVMIGVFITLSCCMFGIFGCIAYNKRRNRTLYSSPVVVTDQSFTPYNPPRPQQPQYPINLHANAQPPSNPYYQQQHFQEQPPLSRNHSPLPVYSPPPNEQPPPPQQQEQQLPQPRAVQMPMPYDDNSSSRTNYPLHPSSPATTATAAPAAPAAHSSTTSQPSLQSRNDDAPPSYHHIDKLRN